MSRPVAVLDACALIPIRLATTLLWLAEAGLFQPLWSDTILDEVQRNLPKVHVDPGTAARRVGMMRNAFGAEALVDGFDELIDDMQCDPKDRHVLAAAVAGGADTIVTFNLKDFPDHAVAPHRVQVLDPDSFLLQLLSEQLETVVSILERETASLRRPPETVTKFLATLTATAPIFANLAADAADEPPGALSPVPALVEADADRAAVSLGEPGDLTNPAQVAVMWWRGLMEDLSLARALSYHPPAWKDYEWAIDLLADRSLGSKVLRAVDAPDRIAFMRFVPEVAATSQVFESYQTAMTFLTLVQIEDGTWRVWGLGSAVYSANDIFGI
ncbi:PIN domain-containing protein [Brevibacterium jeotgali]|nr:PIN domain-containing protein [Brevibacterium jeotgali]TWC01550.1 putative nucleic acid-binding protein [Brevibacterium jeotgali]